MRTRVDIVKGVTRFVLGMGVSYVVTGIIANNTVTDKKSLKVLRWFTGIMIGGMLSKHLGKYTDECIDSVVEDWREAGKNEQSS